MPARLLFLSMFAMLAACGSEIGDSCLLNSDCDPNQTRTCDLTQPEGYCTVIGCDHDTCPDESVCVSFFVGGFTNRTCDPTTEDLSTDDCTFEEVCSLTEQCVPRSAETRYCMRKCGGSGDCRDGYECRDNDLMISHGGQPVLPPDERPTGDLQAFCALAP